ncbi:hypothetical protein FJQ54_04775 [Sandaracinobacter neustonicus]|uniref:Uncharacterized protein n=1 Tax=Sandaracinobacter neustonicus TaxID=1715348 RepID=A0A501XR15_9SPHN|nr:hypothetical protein [Sandaracinobacter neustonicus]TPE62839.1 hypothetical protein FJQ54_04775 [Sandaracinobacter neustonicus]
MAERDPAEARLWLMTLVRLAGLLTVFGGMWLVGRAPETGGPMGGGLMLMAAGAIIVLFGPRALKTRWK